MPLPASVPVGTVTGRWWNTDGTDSTGTIIFLLREQIEVPDRADGVVLPTWYRVPVSAGLLNVTLPAGYYDVALRLSDFNIDHKIIEVVENEALNLPDAVSLEEPEASTLYRRVLSVEGVYPDAYGNIDLPAGGGGGVASVNGDSGPVVVLDSSDVGAAPLVHTHTISNVTGLQTALDSKADDSEVSAIDTRLDALESEPDVRGYDNTGKLKQTFGPGDTSGSWTVVPSAWRLTVNAIVGDVLVMDPSVIANVGSDAEMDVCSVVSGSPARYYSSGTGVQEPNGHGGLYMGTSYNRRLAPIHWVVSASDIEAGTVTLAYMYRSGPGVTWGSGVYPSEISLTNLGSA